MDKILSMDTHYYDSKENIRVGHISIFLEISIDQYLSSLKYTKEIDELYPNAIDHLDRLFFISREKFKNDIQGVVSLCTFMEATINEIGQVELGSKFFKEYADTQNLMAKWKIIPRLAYGKDLPASKVYFENIKKLITSRNNLLHYRTKVSGGIDNNSVKEDLFYVLEKNLKTLDEILSDLYALSPDTGGIPFDVRGQLDRIKGIV